MVQGYDPLGTDLFKEAGREFLSYEPRAAYYSFQDQFKTPAKRRFFTQQFSDIHNYFMGQLGRQIREGGTPTSTFSDVLGQPGFFENRFASATPFERGDPSPALAPRTRSMFFG